MSSTGISPGTSQERAEHDMRAPYLMLVVTALVLPHFAAAQDTRPDILFIAVDDLNDWVGYLGGHPQTLTPNIDGLAARGMAFMNAHSPSALCNPSRTALLTGLRPSTSGIYGNAPDWRTIELFKGVTTLPKHFRDNGYRTYGAGKIFHAHTFAPGGFAGFNDTSAWDAFYPALDRQLPDEVGPPIPLESLVQLRFPSPAISEGALEATVAFVDSFGNLRLFATPADLTAALGELASGSTITVEFLGASSGTRADAATLARTFADRPVGSLLLYTDSSGLLAISVNQGSAARRTGAETGRLVRLHSARP